MVKLNIYDRNDVVYNDESIYYFIFYRKSLSIPLNWIQNLWCVYAYSFSYYVMFLKT